MHHLDISRQNTGNLHEQAISRVSQKSLGSRLHNAPYRRGEWCLVTHNGARHTIAGSVVQISLRLAN
jgi:hypothetical protein